MVRKEYDGCSATVRYVFCTVSITYVCEYIFLTISLLNNECMYSMYFLHFAAQRCNIYSYYVHIHLRILWDLLMLGYRVLLSNNDAWYLDHLEVTWDKMYKSEPTDGLSASSDPALSIGGESCMMWGEVILLHISKCD